MKAMRNTGMQLSNANLDFTMDNIANIGDFVSMVANCIETTSEIVFAGQDELIHRSEG